MAEQGGYSRPIFLTIGLSCRPPHIFRSNAKLKNDTVRTCKELTAKCKIKSNNHFEKLNNKACCTKTQ